MWVEIISVADGSLRKYHDPDAWDDISEYMWSDGNYGCDCNRSLFFARAAGIEPEHADKCGDSAYLVRITDDAGKELYADDDWPETAQQ